MKNLTYLLASLIMVALVVSCSKEGTDDSGVALKDAKISQQSLPVSIGKIAPVILEVDKPKGGNVTCNDVSQAYFTSFDFCGDKLNYGDYDGDGDFEFDGVFPLKVTVEGVFVSFSTENGDCILIGDKYYKVGAVIVKGGNASNIYYYPNGTLSDGGLASPYNASGAPAGLSNLTFCFIECEEKPKELIIVLKTYLQTNGGLLWAGTYGVGSENNSLHLGYVDYSNNVVNNHAIYLDANPDRLAGTLTAWEYIENGIRYLEINLRYPYNGYSFLTSYLYVGTKQGYSNYLTEVDGTVYTDYENFPFQMEENLMIRKFKIPFSSITE